MIKMIAFDCWGTLFGNTQHPHPFSVFAEKIGQNIQERSFLQSFERALMTDIFTDLKVPIQKLLDEYNVKSSAELLHELENLLISSAATQTDYKETREVLHSLRTEYRLAMITNTFPQGFETMCVKYALKDYFEIILTSYQEHVTKPSPVIFAKLLKESQLRPSEILFVGDSLESDILPTEKLGLKNLLIDRRDRYPHYPSRIHDLREIFTSLPSK